MSGVQGTLMAPTNDNKPTRTWLALLEAYEGRALAAEQRCWSIRTQALEEAARLHEQIDVSHGRDPVAVVVEYRDAIRALKEQR